GHRIDVGKDGPGAAHRDRGGGREERKRRDDHLVPRPDPGGEERRVEGGGPVVDGNGVGDAAVGSKLLFEGGSDRTLCDRAGGEDGENRGTFFVSKRWLGDGDV